MPRLYIGCGDDGVVQTLFRREWRLIYNLACIIVLAMVLQRSRKQHQLRVLMLQRACRKELWISQNTISCCSSNTIVRSYGIYECFLWDDSVQPSRFTCPIRALAWDSGNALDETKYETLHSICPQRRIGNNHKNIGKIRNFEYFACCIRNCQNQGMKRNPSAINVQKSTSTFTCWLSAWQSSQPIWNNGTATIPLSWWSWLLLLLLALVVFSIAIQADDPPTCNCTIPNLTVMSGACLPVGSLQLERQHPCKCFYMTYLYADPSARILKFPILWPTCIYTRWNGPLVPDQPAHHVNAAEMFPCR